MNEYVVQKVVRRTDPEGFEATAITPAGETLQLSKLDGEVSWTCDSCVLANGLPHWLYGYGFRGEKKDCVCRETINADENLMRTLDAAALTPMISFNPMTERKP